MKDKHILALLLSLLLAGSLHLRVEFNFTPNSHEDDAGNLTEDRQESF
jgi:hypothetical protein